MTTLIPQVRAQLVTLYPELAAAIAAAADATCAQHVRLVRQQIASARRLEDDAVRDDIPLLLAALSRAFGEEKGMEAMALLGPAHAAAREGQGFSLEEVFGEHVLLRRTLLGQVVSRLGRRLTPAEAEALQSGLDGVLSSTVVSMVAQREARSRLETTALTHFLSSLAHDVRNDINGVSLSMQLLEEAGGVFSAEGQRPNDREARNQIAAFVAEVGSCRRAIDSTVAAMTKLLEAETLRNRISLRPRNVSLRPLMDGIVRSSSRANPRNGRPEGDRLRERIRVDCPEELVVCTDPELLSAILVNLMGNAVKYAPSGTIHFSARPVAGRCRIEVGDEGPGIPPERLQTLFEKYDRAGRRDEGGLGLGLFIARRASALLGARLQVESKVDQGSCFSVELPVRPC